MRRRARRARGGAVAIVRDISASMWGLHAKWASSVILRLVDKVARRAKMRVAYFEFNESSFRLSTARADGPSDDRSAKAELGERATARRVDAADEGFAAAPESAKEALRRRRDAARAFGRNHDAVCDHASNLWCDGLTNYQVALADVLGAYEAASRLGLSGGKHVLMLTDGCPTKGCESLSAERRRARQLGVEIQCVAPKGNAPQDITRLRSSRLSRSPVAQHDLHRRWRLSRGSVGARHRDGRRSVPGHPPRAKERVCASRRFWARSPRRDESGRSSSGGSLASTAQPPGGRALRLER